MRCEFKLVFNMHQYCPYVMSNVSDKKTMISRKNFLEELIDDFEDNGYSFSHIAELHIITIANEKDMSYDFYIKHKMRAIEWKLNAMINKNKSLIEKFPRNWRLEIGDLFEIGNLKVNVFDYYQFFIFCFNKWK